MGPIGLPELIILMLVVGVAFALFKLPRMLSTGKAEGAGTSRSRATTLLIVGVVAAIVAQPVQRSGAQTAFFESMSRGNQLMFLADILQWGGLATAAVGLIMILKGR